MRRNAGISLRVSYKSVRVLFWLLPRRFRSSWVILAVTSFGVLAAITLMAVAAIYSRTLAEGGLQHTLGTTFPTLLNAQVHVRNRPLGPADYRRVRSAVEETSEVRLGDMRRDVQRLGQTEPSPPLLRTREEPLPQAPAFLGQLFFLTEFQEHTELVNGRWPEGPPVIDDQGLALEVVLGRRAAAFMGFQPGSEAYLVPFRADPSERIALKVVGLVEPIDPREEYWMAVPFYFTVHELEERVLVPIYITEESFFKGLGTRYPTLVGDLVWFYYLDSGILTPGTVDKTLEDMEGLKTDINKRFPRSLVLSGLPLTLEEYKDKLTLARASLFLFISLVVLAILYFLAVIMGTVARSWSDEISLLRSRGASVPHVGMLLILGEGPLIIASVAVGPFLALAVVQYLLIPTIDPAGGGSLSAGLSADMFVAGAVGGLLCLAVLVAAAVGLGRLGIVEFLRMSARPPALPLLQRYYIDLAVLVAIGLLWWQIEGKEGFVGQNLLGTDVEVDTTLLLGPVMVMVGSALLLMRVLPLLQRHSFDLVVLVALGVLWWQIEGKEGSVGRNLPGPEVEVGTTIILGPVVAMIGAALLIWILILRVRVLVWARNLFAPAWVRLALVRVERDPQPHGSLAVILMMAAALGLFGAAFQPTLSRSQREQAQYNTGGDLVVQDPYSQLYNDRRIAALPDLGAVSPVNRATVSLLDGLAGTSANLLMVDPVSLPETAWFRDDLADKALPDLLRPLAQTLERREGPILPLDTEKVGLWANVESLQESDFHREMNLWIRVMDREGRHRNLLLGELPNPGSDETEEWTYLEAELPRQSVFLSPPFSVASIYISGGRSFRSRPGGVNLDDLTVTGPETLAEGLVIDGFETPGVWSALPGPQLEPDTVIPSVPAARTGRLGISLFWSESNTTNPVGMFVPPGGLPLPSIGGPMFKVGESVRVMLNGRIVAVTVSEVTDYFPTLSPSIPFLLVSIEEYRSYLSTIPGGQFDPPKEYWVSVAEDADREEVLLSMSEVLPPYTYVRDRQKAADLAQRDPLAGGGWNGLTIVNMSALTIVVVLALAIYAHTSLRTARVDLSVVRAMGLSKTQLLLSLALERFVVAVVGIAAGTVIGLWLGDWVLGYLDITAGGRAKVPPMVITLQYWLIALVFLELLVALVTVTFFASRLAGKLKASDILRTAQ